MVQFGIDALLRTKADSARIGLVTNDAAKTTNGISSRRALLDSGFNLVRLFSPEHGIGASVADGEAVADGADPLTRLPVVSLYGEETRPSLESLADLDLILFDIPDVGVRFYTYIWTLSHVLEACAEARKPLWVLDRPNPIGGNLADAEGPILDETFVSTFVGRWAMPIRYSLTIGELARLWNRERRIGADVRVVTMQGWRREMHWPDTGLRFVPTSPAIRDYQTALLYPGTCLLEGTNLSEGRGTKTPFRAIGAPWLDSESLAKNFNEFEPAIRATEISFVPTARKYERQACRGILIDVINPKSLRPVRFGLHLIATVIRMHPDTFSFAPYPTAANETGGGHFDRLAGKPIQSALRDQTLNIEQCTWAGDWKSLADAHLLYM
jgi:uncharacterized protein YbbC (DUF1343 family)